MKNVELVTIRELPWINRGHVYRVHDLLTGLKYNIVGEHNNQRHADYVCATRLDTELKLKTANGNFNNNWAARPVILTIDNNDGRGARHFAASTHNAAHAPDMTRWRNPSEIGHSGHFCIWVLGGTTGGSEAYRRSMIEAVHEAYRLAGNMPQNADSANTVPPADEPPSLNTVKFNLNGIVSDIEGYIENGITWAKARQLLEGLGYCVGWDHIAGMVTVERNEGLLTTTEELDILHRIVWAESRGEDLQGQILVANVVLNRLNSPQFPDTIQEVVFQTNQFEPVRSGAFDRATPTEKQIQAVAYALSGRDYSQGALWFNGTHMRETSWAGQNRHHLFDHGGHSFYI